MGTPKTADRQPSLSRPESVVLFLVFLLSGASSLTYQILWVRSLSLILGSTVLSISLVVSAFMAGLALGSDLLGRVADRGRSPLRQYALLEGAIALCAILMPLMFQSIDGASWYSYVTSYAAILVPTTLMGGTLPVLSRFAAGVSGTRGRMIGALYAVNTLGAVAGTALTGFVFIRAFGIAGATYLAAGMNLAACAAALVLSRCRPQPVVLTTDPPATTPEGAARLIGLVTAVFFVNGLAGIGAEVLWTRAILLFTTNSIYAFTVILTTFLAGIAMGSALMSSIISRISRPAMLLGGFQCLIGLIIALTPAAWSAAGANLLETVSNSTSLMGTVGLLVGAYVVAALFMLPATLLMGASFPLVAQIVTLNTDRVGTAVGRVYAVNTIGAVLGSLLAGFVLLPWLGIQRAMFVTALVLTVAGLTLILRTGSRIQTALAVSTAALVIGLLARSPDQFRHVLEQRMNAEFTFYEEGLETTVAVYNSNSANRPVLVINNSRLADHGVVHKMLAHLPALIHPDPQRALAVGFGVGMTSQSFSVHGIEANECVEISSSVMNAAPHFADLNGNITQRGDEHFRLILDDARRFLATEGEAYDIIALDANSGVLENAGVGKLYSYEFFKQCRKRLSDNGIVTVYVSPNARTAQFKMVARTFMDVFPHATLWVDRVYGETTLLLATRRPLRIDVEHFQKRLAQPEVARDLRDFDLEQPGMLLSCFTMGPELLSSYCRDGERNSDANPVMEFHPLLVSPFDQVDRVFHLAGFPLHRESVRPWLDEAGQLPAAVDEYLAAADRAFPLQLDAWAFESDRNSRNREQALLLAARLHPQGDHLQRALGEAGIITSSNLSAISAHAGWLAFQRKRYNEAVHHFKQAIEQSQRLPHHADEDVADWHVYRARAHTALGNVTAARSALNGAAVLTAHVMLAHREIDYAEQSATGTAAVGLISRLREDYAARGELLKAFEMARELETRGLLDAELAEFAGGCLMSFADLPGAYRYFQKAVRLDPDRRSAHFGQQASLAQLSLRADVLRKAYPGDDGWQSVLKSPLTAESVSLAELLTVDHRTATPWLELARLYLQAGSRMMAYRTARAARYHESDCAAAYVLMGNASQGRLSQLAFEYALHFEPDNADARRAVGLLAR